MCRESSYPLSHALEDLPPPYGKKRPPKRKTCLLKLPALLGHRADTKDKDDDDEEQIFRELYQSRARELLEHCPKSWRDTTPERQPSVFRGYLEAYARGGGGGGGGGGGRALALGPENEAYIRKAIDSYCACLQRADEIVAAAGLRRPAGARSCELWDEAFTPGQRAAWDASAAAAFLDMGRRLGPRLCCLRMQDRPHFSKPLQYVTMCVWETAGHNAAHREDMLMQLEEAEGRVLRRCLLADHERWYPACGCLDGGGVEAFRAFYHDNRRGSHAVVPRAPPPPYGADGY
ncbi:hypothetical protein VSDG_01372 [Cytospora chrysosperma]|uniref:Uncharacterized protein n=1 Tax=Cytospora chrysosperma TaxID=252740 RepID=A0A423WJ02_CYTCH|nr:hypothetical protein VSDG_01372 [Valsa sordida]